MNAWYFLIPVVLPIVLAVLLPFIGKDKKDLHSAVAFSLVLELAVVLVAVLRISGSFTLLQLGDFPLLVAGDTIGRFFAVLFSVVFLMAALFGFEYFAHDHHELSYSVFYLLTLASLEGLCFAGNMFTYYMFYEMMTVCSLPLVLHERTAASRAAAMQYLGYSLFGASMALLGFFFAERQCYSTAFAAGGSLSASMAAAHPQLTLVAAFCMLAGFGGKAGLLPLHAWLPIAHPEAPAPASAVLSGIITKGGVLGIIRTAYFVFGAQNLRGTWVQTCLLTLALCTVFMGSMLAYKEKVLKRRLAWSTVSQVSYALFGLFLFCEAGLCGALLQIVFHALSKVTLFLCAGAIIHSTGFTLVGQLRGIGKRMPVVMWCFALASLSLIGIPPMGGFVSKWYLAQGGLQVMGGLGWIGAAVLLISALLTAGYLMPIVAAGFFPGKNWPEMEKIHLDKIALAPLIAGSAALAILGIWPTALINLFTAVAGSIL